PCRSGGSPTQEEPDMSGSTYLHFTTAGNSGTVGSTGSGAVLRAVNVNTGAASAVLTIRDGSATGPIIAVIDATAKGCYQYEDIVVGNGVYATLTGGNADVTVTVG